MLASPNTLSGCLPSNIEGLKEFILCLEDRTLPYAVIVDDHDRVPEILTYFAHLINTIAGDDPNVILTVNRIISVFGDIFHDIKDKQPFFELEYAHALSMLVKYSKSEAFSECVIHTKSALKSIGSFYGANRIVAVEMIADIATRTKDAFCYERLNYFLADIISRIQVISGKLVYITEKETDRGKTVQNSSYNTLLFFCILNKLGRKLDNTGISLLAKEYFPTEDFIVKHIAISWEQAHRHLKTAHSFETILKEEIKLYEMLIDYSPTATPVLKLSSKVLRLLLSNNESNICTDIYSILFFDLVLSVVCIKIYQRNGDCHILAKGKCAFAKVKVFEDKHDSGAINVFRSFYLSSLMGRLTLDYDQLDEKSENSVYSVPINDYPMLMISQNDLKLKIFGNSFPKFFLILCHSYPKYLKDVVEWTFDSSESLIGRLKKMSLLYHDLQRQNCDALPSALKFDLSRQRLLCRYLEKPTCLNGNYKLNNHHIGPEAGQALILSDLSVLTHMKWHPATKISIFTTSFIEIKETESFMLLKMDPYGGKVIEFMINELDNLILRNFRKPTTIKSALIGVLQHLDHDEQELGKIRNLVINKILKYNHIGVLNQYG